MIIRQTRLGYTTNNDGSGKPRTRRIIGKERDSECVREWTLQEVCEYDREMESDDQTLRNFGGQNQH